jgi:hypothetical protein
VIDDCADVVRRINSVQHPVNGGYAQRLQYKAGRGCWLARGENCGTNKLCVPMRHDLLGDTDHSTDMSGWVKITIAVEAGLTGITAKMCRQRHCRSLQIPGYKPQVEKVAEVSPCSESLRFGSVRTGHHKMRDAAGRQRYRVDCSGSHNRSEIHGRAYRTVLHTSSSLLSGDRCSVVLSGATCRDDMRADEHVSRPPKIHTFLYRFRLTCSDTHNYRVI